MFNLDNPVFPIVLLAALGGLRLAAYVMQRQARNAAARTPLPLAPDAASEQDVVLSATAGESSICLTAPDGAGEPGVAPPAAEPPLPARRAAEPDHPFIVEVLDAAIIAVVLVYLLIRPFLLQAFIIPSGSMIPTLREGDKLMATKYTYHLRQPHRDDVVVFRAPEMAILLHNPNDKSQPDYVKRIVGIPGDRIRIVAGVGVYRNRELIEEPYVRDVPNYDYPMTNNGGELIVPQEVIPQIGPNIDGNELVVPPGYLFVLGDNRNGSHDSHIWGLLERKRLVGKAAFIFWPPARWGTIH